MITWFTEDSTLPMISGVLLAVIFLGLAFSSREKIMVYLALAIAMLTAATVICERMIVTDKETVKDIIYDIASAVESNDLSRVITYISPKRQDTIDRAKSEMPRYDFTSCRVIGQNYIEQSEEDPDKIEICFPVSFQVRVDGGAEAIPGHRRIILEFERQSDGSWKMITYHHESPYENLSL